MAWIESHQSLASHRKTKALKRLLKINTVKAIGHLHLLWWWCLDNAPDGNLEGIHPHDISEAAEWTGDPELFINSLIESGFCDANPTKLHDWDEYAGKLIQRRIANRERVKAFRNAHVTITKPLRNGATVPNSTQHNSTNKDIQKVITLPEWLNPEIWKGFVDSRKKIKKPMTENAEILLIEKLTKAKEQGFDPNELIKEAIINGWQSIVVRPGDSNNGRKNINIDKKDEPVKGW